MTDRLTPVVEQAMREAARVAIMPRFRTEQARVLADKANDPHAADGKPSESQEPVTAADRESEEILATRLSAIIPGAGVVGEEAVHADVTLLERLGSGTCWLIDPLDGTANFAAGQGPFGMLVALVEDGLPVGGWILDPLSGRFCAARSGEGATSDGRAFAAAPSNRKRPLVAVTKLFANRTERERLMEILQADHDLVDSPRCAADQYPRVAEGGNDVTLFTRTLPWDHAAGVVFLNEAGGRAARPDGRPYRCDDGGQGMIVATSPALWDAMATRLSSIGRPLSGTGGAA